MLRHRCGLIVVGQNGLRHRRRDFTESDRDELVESAHNYEMDVRWSLTVWSVTVDDKCHSEAGSFAHFVWVVERGDSRCVSHHLVPQLCRFHHCRCS